MSVIRSFFSAFFATLGILLALALLVIIPALQEKQGTAPASFRPKVLHDAQGQQASFSQKIPSVLFLRIEDEIGTKELTTENLRQLLFDAKQKIVDKQGIKALFLSINCRGGSVIDSDGIYRLLKDFKETTQVPIYAYVDGICTSGALYIAACADQIFASEVSIIGSVGVMSRHFFNVHEILEKWGIQAKTLTAGKGKDALNPTREWQNGEEKILQELIAFYYQRFVDILCTERPQIQKKKLIREWGARVFHAQQAKDFGFIDELSSSREKVLQALVERAGISDAYQVFELEKNDWLHQFNFPSSCCAVWKSLTSSLSYEKLLYS